MKNQTVVFILPDDISRIDIVDEILKNNGLEESADEFFEKDIQGIEPRSIIVRDAAITIAQKKISEEKVIELLAEHLEIKKHTAEKIVQDIKEKLIPFARVIEESENLESGENFQEELLNKIRTGRSAPATKEEPPESYLKKVPITDVEKNAQEMEEEGKNLVTKEKNKFPKSLEEAIEIPPQEKEQDKYKESIE